jgi:MFS family permease
MIAARQHAHDPISFVAIALPVSAVILHLAATFLVPSSLGGISTALIAASFLIVFASGPFAGVVALRAWQINERRMKRALLGLVLGVGFSVLFVYGTWLVQSRTRDAQGCLETQAEQAMNGTPIALVFMMFSRRLDPTRVQRSFPPVRMPCLKEQMGR